VTGFGLAYVLYTSTITLFENIGELIMKRNPTLYFAIALLALSLTPTIIHAQNLGDSKVFSPVAAPGYPEGIAVNGNSFYVSGPAALGPPLGSAYVKAYNLKTGAFEASYPITITNQFAGMSGASCAAFGPDGDLYLVEPFVGIIRMGLDAANTQSVLLVVYTGWSIAAQRLSLR